MGNQLDVEKVLDIVDADQYRGDYDAEEQILRYWCSREAGCKHCDIICLALNVGLALDLRIQIKTLLRCFLKKG